MVKTSQVTEMLTKDRISQGLKLAKSGRGAVGKVSKFCTKKIAIIATVIVILVLLIIGGVVIYLQQSGKLWKKLKQMHFYFFRHENWHKIFSLPKKVQGKYKFQNDSLLVSIQNWFTYKYKINDCMQVNFFFQFCSIFAVYQETRLFSCWKKASPVSSSPGMDHISM